MLIQIECSEKYCYLDDYCCFGVVQINEVGKIQKEDEGGEYSQKEGKSE